MSRPAQAVLYTEHLLQNIALIKSKVGNSSITAMVKANAYGHGLRSVSLRIKNSVDKFGVASIDEAVALRKVGIQNPIVLMEGVFCPDELRIAVQEQFELVFHTQEQIDWLKQTGIRLSA